MKKHILIVEDEVATARMLELMLRSKEYSSTCANNGLEGLDLLKADPGKYQMVLLDWMMPVMPGEQFLHEFFANPEFNEIPVILQTGLSDTPEIKQALDNGVKCCLKKPYERKELLSAIENVLKLCG
jgi:CheY-like chemotaxis protein